MVATPKNAEEVRDLWEAARGHLVEDPGKRVHFLKRWEVREFYDYPQEVVRDAFRQEPNLEKALEVCSKVMPTIEQSKPGYRSEATLRAEAAERAESARRAEEFHQSEEGRRAEAAFLAKRDPVSRKAATPADSRWADDPSGLCRHDLLLGTCTICKNDNRPSVYLTSGGLRYHSRPDCEALVDGQGKVDDRLGNSQPIEKAHRGSDRLDGRSPCRICRPL